MGRFTQLGTATVEIRAPLDKYKRDLKGAERQTKKSTKKMARSIDKMRLSISRVRANVLAYKFAWAASAAAVILSIKTVTTAAIVQEKAVSQLNARIKSTKGVAGLASTELQNMASSLQRVTTFGDELIISGQAMLLTFTQIGKDVFPRALEASLDLATAFGGDLQSAIVQVGKALNDPILGITALRRVGIQFTSAQEDTIKKLVESNNLLEAQGLILAELETQFGGAARAARDTMGGALTALSNIIGDKFETAGFTILKFFDPLIRLTIRSLENTDGLTKSVDELTKAYKNLGKTTATIELDKIIQAIANITDPKTGKANVFFEQMFAQLKRSEEALKRQLGIITKTRARYDEVIERIKEINRLSISEIPNIATALEMVRLAVEAGDLAQELGIVAEHLKTMNAEAERLSNLVFVPIEDQEITKVGGGIMFDIPQRIKQDTEAFAMDVGNAQDALIAKNEEVQASFDKMKASFFTNVQQPMSGFFLSLIKNTKDLKGAFQVLIDAMNQEIADFLARAATKMFFKLFLNLVIGSTNPVVGAVVSFIQAVNDDSGLPSKGSSGSSSDSEGTQVTINIGEEQLAQIILKSEDFQRRRSVGALA